MRREILRKIEIPDGVNVSLSHNNITVNGPNGESSKRFIIKGVKVDKHEGEIVLHVNKGTKKEKKLVNTLAAHVKNMMHGSKDKFEYKLKICFSHFPIKVEKEGNELKIRNFLGEKIARSAKILNGVDVEIKGDIIHAKSHNKELAGQTAANFEKATRISLRDRRVFQDGIYITSKPGRDLE